MNGEIPLKILIVLIIKSFPNRKERPANAGMHPIKLRTKSRL
jgi:hypothetical protein